ncbi:MAG: phosphatase PAP2 family protein [Muribaculaceae bacterium]|nr:phosphatase PAP2 family protein [Muribaculaceae bacterium]
MIRLIIAFVLLAAVLRPALMCGQEVDSVKIEDRSTQFRPTQLILPASLIAVGALGFCGGVFDDTRNWVRDEVQCMSGGQKYTFDDYVQYLPVASYMGLGLINGVEHRHSLLDRTLVTATSWATLAILVRGSKYFISSPRPGERGDDSFPSGHTSTAFMGAELVRMEYGTGYAIGAYAVACGVGFMRMWNDRHWVTDVIAGAGVGILSARVGYWMLPVWRKVFNMKDSNKAITIVPYYNSQAFGASMAMVF